MRQDGGVVHWAGATALALTVVAVATAPAHAQTAPPTNLRLTTYSDVEAETPPAALLHSFSPSFLDGALAVVDQQPEEAGKAALPPPQRDDGWEFEFAPYVWATSLRGHVDVGPISTTPEACFTDLLKDLDGAVMFRFEGRRSPWGFYLETLYMSLAADGHKFALDVDNDFTQTEVDFGGLYRFGDDWPHFDLMLGGRYTHLESDVSIGPLDLDSTDDFVSPVVGGRFQVLLDEKWVLSLKADVAGFSVGDAPDLTWGATGILGYRLSERTTLAFGYRYYDVRVGPDLDVQYHGPMIGVAWQF